MSIRKCYINSPADKRICHYRGNKEPNKFVNKDLSFTKELISVKDNSPYQKPFEYIKPMESRTFPNGESRTFPNGESRTFPNGESRTFPNGESRTFPNGEKINKNKSSEKIPESKNHKLPPPPGLEIQQKTSNKKIDLKNNETNNEKIKRGSRKKISSYPLRKTRRFCFKNRHSETIPNWRIKNKKYITSYGCCVYAEFQSVDPLGKIKKYRRYLCYQRRDTIAYTEFLGNHIKDDETFKKMIRLMSKDEKKRIILAYKKNDIQSLIDDLWVNPKSKNYKRDAENSIETIKSNIEKYLSILQDDSIGLEENPWGFPKGRKHNSETEKTCALREFEEETNINKNVLKVFPDKKFEEIYTGSDNKLYKSVFYLAEISPEYCVYPVYKSSIYRNYVTEEAKDICWMTYDYAITKLDKNKAAILTEIENYLNSE